jgi:hypothetical protein
MMRCRTGLHTNEARRQFLEERQDVATLQLTAEDHLAIGVNAVHLKTRLGDVETDCLNCLHAAAGAEGALGVLTENVRHWPPWSNRVPELKFANRFDAYCILDRHQDPRTNEDLPGLGFVTKPRRNIGYRYARSASRSGTWVILPSNIARPAALRFVSI